MNQNQNRSPQPEQHATAPIDNPYEVITEHNQALALEQIADYIAQGGDRVVGMKDGVVTQQLGRMWRNGEASVQGTYDEITGHLSVSKITNGGKSYEKFDFRRDKDSGITLASWSASQDLQEKYQPSISGTEWNSGSDDLRWETPDGSGISFAKPSAVKEIFADSTAPAPVRTKAMEVAQAITKERLSSVLPELLPQSKAKRLSKRIGSILTAKETTS